MYSKKRINQVMRGLGTPDQIPLMCQLSLGHIYKNAGIPPEKFWFTPEGLAEGYIRMAERYNFDGILVNVWTGVEKQKASNICVCGDGHNITLENNQRFYCPPNDNPYQIDCKAEPVHRSIEEVDAESIPIYPDCQAWLEYFGNVLYIVLAKAQDRFSIHGEVGTVFETFLWQFGSLADGLMALIDDPGKSHKIMKRLNQRVILAAVEQCRRGVDAMKLSSPIAGAGFISKEMYEEFVLPYEREVVAAIHAVDPETPCYVHTCGSIGDRLDLMAKIGADGLECLDPPPLGTVDLAKAVEEIGDKMFIKGNLDSVNELLGHTPEEVRQIALNRLKIGSKCNRGYILSSACSVAPDVPPENILALAKAVEDFR
ncbi:MAG: hypothetical protein NT118_17180 [Lentisphaerae bacterium]|nr:hypothetical protein [Lentisphaerota bacterium]